MLKFLLVHITEESWGGTASACLYSKAQKISSSFGPILSISPIFSTAAFLDGYSPPLARWRVAALLQAHTSGESPEMEFHWASLGHALYSESIMMARGNGVCSLARP